MTEKTRTIVEQAKGDDRVVRAWRSFEEVCRIVYGKEY